MNYTKPSRYPVSVRTGFAIAWLSAAVMMVGGEAPGFCPVDLTHHYNKLANSWPAGRCWSVVPWGHHVYDGVPFEWSGILEVTGTDAAQRVGEAFAGRYTGIRVGQAGAWIHLVHGAGWKEDDGVAIARLKLHYENGQTSELPIRYGVHVRNWWKEPSEPDERLADPNSKVIWSAPNPEPVGRPITLRLYKTSIANPHPDWVISTLEVQSLFTHATPVFVALTVGRAGEGVSAVGTEVRSEPAAPQAQSTVIVRAADSGQPVGGARLRLVVSDAERDYPFGEQTTDAAGRSALEFPRQQITRLNLRVSATGYAVAQLSTELRNLPSVLVVKLEPGLTIGGVVQDPTGRPIAGVKVTINQTLKDAVGQIVLSEIETVTTAADGRWQSASIPRQAVNLNFALAHPKFISLEYDEAKPSDGIDNFVTRQDLRAGRAVMKMQPGITVAGRVETEQHRPVANATVQLLPVHAADQPVSPQSVSADAQGAFELTRFETGSARLAVFAPGFAPAAREIEIKPGLEPQRFTLPPAVPIKGRVTNDQGEPIPHATLRVEWKGLRLPETAVTDAEGQFSLNSLPDDFVVVTVAGEGYAETSTQVSAASPPAGDGLALKLTRVFQLSGKVVDAESGKAVPAFTLIRGRVLEMWSGEEQVNWEWYDKTAGANGAYSVGLGRAAAISRPAGFPDENFKFLIQAKGYLPAIAPAVKSRGWHQCDFQLRRGEGPSGVVVSPTGQRVEGAQVAIEGVGYLQMGKASLIDNSRSEGLVKTDHNGEFELPAYLPSPRLLVVHESGMAEVAADELAKDNFLHLQSWGRIEGVAKAGTKPWPSQEITLTDPLGTRRLNFQWSAYKTTSDAEGRFSFETVPPGEWQLVRLVRQNENSWSHSDQLPITVKPGATLAVTVGGVGRPVIGKLALSDPNRKVDFNRGWHNFNSRMIQPPAEFRTPEKFREWRRRPEVRAAQKEYRNYGFRIAEDGAFRLENIPPGTYDLMVQLQEAGPQANQFGRPIGSVRQEVVVKQIPGGVSDEPLDLGTLTIQVQDR